MEGGCEDVNMNNKLLEKALRTKTHTRIPIQVSEDEEDLAIAYLQGQINMTQYCAAVAIPRGGTGGYTAFHHAIRSMFERGRIKFR